MLKAEVGPVGRRRAGRMVGGVGALTGSGASRVGRAGSRRGATTAGAATAGGVVLVSRRVYAVGTGEDVLFHAVRVAQMTASLESDRRIFDVFRHAAVVVYETHYRPRLTLRSLVTVFLQKERQKRRETRETEVDS